MNVYYIAELSNYYNPEAEDPLYVVDVQDLKKEIDRLCKSYNPHYELSELSENLEGYR